MAAELTREECECREWCGQREPCECGWCLACTGCNCCDECGATSGPCAEDCPSNEESDDG